MPGRRVVEQPCAIESHRYSDRQVRQGQVIRQGREAKVKVKGPSGFETLRGVITSADATGLSIKVDDVERRLEFADVASASTVFVWQKNPKPGSKGRR